MRRRGGLTGGLKRYFARLLTGLFKLLHQELSILILLRAEGSGRIIRKLEEIAESISCGNDNGNEHDRAYHALLEMPF